MPGRYPQWVRNIHPDDKKRVLDAWVRAVETRSDFKCQWRYKNTLKDNAGARDFIFVLANAVAIDNFVRDAEYLTDKSGVKQLEYIAGSGPAEVADLESPAKSYVDILYSSSTLFASYDPLSPGINTFQIRPNFQVYALGLDA